MVHRILAVALAAATLPLLSASPSEAGTTFTFYGSGYGHGLGLSQWGSYGLALKGWSHQKILTHFYSGTAVGGPPGAPGRLRIGLAQEARTVHLTVTHGSVTLTLGSPRGKIIGRPFKQGETWRVIVDRSGKYKVLDSAGNIVGGHLWGSGKVNVYANFAGTGMVNVPESGHTYNRGYIEFNVYHSGGCYKLGYCERLIIVLRPQGYLYGLGEVPSGWPMEAMEAQAVAARTYAFEKVNRIGQHRPLCNCALYDDTRDQVYAGWDKEGGPEGSRWVAAVNNTNGQAVLYAGALIQAYYFSSSGGFTENNENVWGGAPLPYLRGVCDPGDYTDQNPSRVWTVGPLSNTAVASALRPYTGDIGKVVTNFTNYVRGVSGRIITINVVGTQGRHATVDGWMIRAGLQLKDDKVWINGNWNITGGIRTKYDSRKLMCAPGLAASKQMFVSGGREQRFAAGAIYWNDSKSAAYWQHGPTYDKYRGLGESGGLLGMPTSDVIPLTPPNCSGVTCDMVTFAHGNIYYKDKPGVGAHELDGFVLGYYVNLQPPAYLSHLGFPVTDVNLNQQDGSTWATFESGSTVTCSKDGNCVEQGGRSNLSVRISIPRWKKVGTKVRYVVSVRNAGRHFAKWVVVSDTLPRGVKLISTRSSQGKCRGRRPVTCWLGSLRPGATATIKLLVLVL
jgi:SpoIID/LytB domain protein/uncharacterized repeat protein (TIGR01451 family)